MGFGVSFAVKSTSPPPQGGGSYRVHHSYRQEDRTVLLFLLLLTYTLSQRCRDNWCIEPEQNLSCYETKRRKGLALRVSFLGWVRERDQWYNSYNTLFVCKQTGGINQKYISVKVIIQCILRFSWYFSPLACSFPPQDFSVMFGHTITHDPSICIFIANGIQVMKSCTIFEVEKYFYFSVFPTGMSIGCQIIFRKCTFL